MRWIGLLWFVRALGRALSLLATRPETRRSYKTDGSTVGKTFDSSGCGLFVGRK